MDLKKILNKAHQNQKSVLLLGTLGIGKSMKTYSWAETKAKELNRELVIWHELTWEEKKNVSDNTENYFVCVDIKLQSVGDPSKLSGIPIIQNNGEARIVWQPPEFVKVFTKDGASGLLFLDECNMALPSLQSIAFEIALQRKLGEWSLGNDILIVLAGNTLESNIAANPIPKPLVNRLCRITCDVPSAKGWIKWATDKNVDARIIAFIQLFEELYKESDEELAQTTTPRSYELLSGMIQGEEDIDYIRDCSLGYLHEATAAKFNAFIRNMYNLDYKEFIEDFSRFRTLSNENKYAVVALISLHMKKIDEDKLTDFIANLADDVLELSAILLSMIKVTHTKKAVTKILRKMDKELIGRIGYLVAEE